MHDENFSILKLHLSNTTANMQSNNVIVKRKKNKFSISVNKDSKDEQKITSISNHVRSFCDDKSYRLHEICDQGDKIEYCITWNGDSHYKSTSSRIRTLFKWFLFCVLILTTVYVVYRFYGHSLFVVWKTSNTNVPPMKPKQDPSENFRRKQ